MPRRADNAVDRPPVEATTLELDGSPVEVDSEVLSAGGGDPVELAAKLAAGPKEQAASLGEPGSLVQAW
jgi:hypothetical protein